MPKVSVSLSLEDDLVRRIDEVGAQEDLRRSWIVGRVLTGWLESRVAPTANAQQFRTKPPGVGRPPKPRGVAAS